MSTKNILFVALCLSIAVAQAVVLDWSKIRYWVGEGENSAALVVQFYDNGPHQAYVWGFRWNDDDYPDGAPSGEDMFRAIAAASNDILLFTQYTGSLGSTVCGIGYYNPAGEPLTASLAYDFDSAQDDPRISFNYFTTNELMGQTKVPGVFTPIYCQRAIDNAAETHIIEHPVNARDYGYPAYDYDWWQPSEELDNENQRWNAGWYDGYWSYWVGGVDFDQLSYSGLGMSSRKLSDGQVDAWKFAMLSGPVVYNLRRQNPLTPTASDVDASTGASEQWYELNYDHFAASGLVETITDSGKGEVMIYDASGKQIAVAHNETEVGRMLARMQPGIYITRCGNVINKLLIK